MIFVNFKTYEQGSGEKALFLAKLMLEVSSQEGVKLVPVVQSGDIREVVSATNMEVWAQHIDPADFGAHTGSIIPEGVKEDGAAGTFLNHSEHKFERFEELQKAHERAKSVGLKTLIFAGNIDELQKNIKLNPDYISYEPPELVGSTETSVSREKPEVIGRAVKIAKDCNIPLIVGAGIKSESDIKVSLELGAKGFAIASSIVKAEDPKKELLTLLKGYK